jgi:hypothetical protein
MGGSSNPHVTQTNTTELSPQQTQLSSFMMPYASAFASTPMSAYGGPTVAGFTPEQQAGQAGATGISAPAGTALGTQAAGAQSAMLSPNMTDIANNPNFQGMAGSITDLANRNLMENILPSIRSGSTVAGGQYAGGGTREALGEGKAIGDTAIGTNSAISQLAAQMYGQGLQAQNQAIGQNPSVQAQQLFGPEVQSAVGGQQQNLNQQQLNANQALYYLQQQMPFLQASDITSLIGAMPGATGVSTATGSVPQPSALSMGLGGAAGLGAITPFLKWMLPGATSGAGAGAAGGAGAAAADAGGFGSSLASFLPFLAL